LRACRGDEKIEQHQTVVEAWRSNKKKKKERKKNRGYSLEEQNIHIK
jgi:hypothetical protein